MFSFCFSFLLALMAQRVLKDLIWKPTLLFLKGISPRELVRTQVSNKIYIAMLRENG